MTESETTPTTTQTSQFPSDLPLVPLREAVVFPKLVVPLGVGREKSVAAINAAMNEEKHYIVLAAQKDGEVDDVTPEQLARQDAEVETPQPLQVTNERTSRKPRTRQRQKGVEL